MPLFSRKKKARAGGKAKGSAGKSRKAAPAPSAAKAEADGSGDDSETEEDLLGDQSWAKTADDAFSSEVDALFMSMKATMGAAESLPDVKFGKMGDEMAGKSDFENEAEAEPEPEPEPKPKPKRVKLTKEEKMAKMKAMAKAREAEAAAAAGEATEVELTPQEQEDAALMKRCEEIFQKYDADGGGDIDAEEFASLCFDMGLVFEDEDDKKLVLTMLDTDGDGTVSLDEFKVWWVANKDSFFVQEYSEDVKAAIYYFKKFDEDLSGELDQTEFVAMCREMKWDAKSTAMSLVYLDTDGDGMISFQEFLAWYTSDGLVTNTMRVYDADKSNSLNQQEFTNLAKDWGLDEKIAGKIFRKFDVDKDGELNMEELKSVLAKTKK